MQTSQFTDHRTFSLQSDEYIIRQVLGGSKDAYSELLRRYQGSAYGLAYRILGRREEAEDAVQDAFVRAYMNLESYEDRGVFWAWIRRILVNVCMTRFSRRSARETLGDLPDFVDETACSVEEEVINRATNQDVQDAVRTLPFEYRTVVVLRYQEGLSYKEIADLEGDSVASLKVRMHRAKKMLADRLGGVINELR